jgi:hypothetical protein
MELKEFQKLMKEKFTYKKIEKIVQEYDSKLKATHKGFRNAVHIIHEEGTVLFYQNAFLRKIIDVADDSWIIVFTEHHGYHIYHSTDLDCFIEYTRSYEKVKILEV